MAAKTEDVTTKKPEAIKGTDAAGAGATNLAEAAKPATPAPTPAQGRRAPGTKEPIQFLWKLVGHSAGFALTLFKAVEREEVEAQLARIHREGYYTDLKVLDINAKVIQPTPRPAARTAGKSGKAKTPAKTPAKAAKNTQPSRSTAASKTPAASKTAKAAKASKVKRTAPETKKHKRTPDARAASKPRPRAKASRDKSAAKTAKKKSAKAASTKKRSAKSTTKKK